MSTLQQRLERATQNGKVIDVSSNPAKSVSAPQFMNVRFGLIYPNTLTTIYNLEPLPLISNNLESYRNAINSLGLKNGKDYIRAWEDMFLIKNYDTLDSENKAYVDNLNRQIELVDKYSKGEELSTNEFDELQRLKNSRLIHTTDYTFPIQELKTPVQEVKISEEAQRNKEMRRIYASASRARSKLAKGEQPTEEQIIALNIVENRKRERAGGAMSPATLSPRNNNAGYLSPRKLSPVNY